MCKFYKGRYLISIYNKKEELLNVFDNAKEMHEYYRNMISECYLFEILRNVYKGKNYEFFGMNIHFIDVFEITPDIFMEEDIEFAKSILDEEIIKEQKKDKKIKKSGKFTMEMKEFVL